MARPTKYSAEEFTKKIDDFIEYCEKEKAEPSDYRLLKFLAVSTRTLERYYGLVHKEDEDDQSESDGDSNKIGFGGAIKKLDLFREDYSLRQVNANPKLAGHVAFKLKQPHWGGWSDKQDSSKDTNLNITIHGGDARNYE